MHAAQFDPELSRQMFENAIATAALSFIALAALAAVLVCIFIVCECLRLTNPPQKIRSRRRLQLIRGSAKAPKAVKALAMPLLVLLLLASPASGQEDSWAARVRHASELEWQGDFQGARRILLGIANTTRSPRPDERTLAFVFNNLGALAQKTSDFPEAEKCYRESLRQLDRIGEPETAFRGTPLNNLAILYSVQRQFSKAAKLFAEVSQNRIAVHGPMHPRVAMAYHNLAITRMMQRKYGDADRDMHKALSILAALPNSGHELGIVQGSLARLYFARRAYPQAQSAAQGAFVLLEPYADAAASIDALLVDALSAAAEGASDPGERQLQRALALSSKAFGEQSRQFACALLAQAEWNRLQKHKAESKRLAEIANGLLAAHGQENSPGQTVDYGLLRVTSR
jgi:tetratricopeptide (TPR) repeat protein